MHEIWVKLQRIRDEQLDSVEESQVFLQSLDVSLPESSQIVSLSTLRASLKKACGTLGISWTEHLGDYLVALSIGKDSLTSTKVVEVINGMKRIPRKITRHPKRIVIFGAGAFGTALAFVCCSKGHHVALCFRDEETEYVTEFNRTQVNSMCFPAYTFPKNIIAVCYKNVPKLLSECELIIHAIPVQFSEAYLSPLSEFIPDNVAFINASKGISIQTLECMHVIIQRVLGQERGISVFSLSGPSFAEGIMEGDPTTVTLAHTSSVPEDVVWLELSGALKNILALACGIARGCGYGPNTQASVITRGWSDITRIVRCLGGDTQTLLGLSGLGDLMMTCYGGSSRNAMFGELLVGEMESSSGKSQEEIIGIVMKKTNGIVEGYYTAQAVLKLVSQHSLEVRVLEAIHAVLAGKLMGRDMIVFIMSLPLQEEFPYHDKR